jgi:hypothetical protein
MQRCTHAHAYAIWGCLWFDSTGSTKTDRMIWASLVEKYEQYVLVWILAVNFWINLISLVYVRILSKTAHGLIVWTILVKICELDWFGWEWRCMHVHECITVS